ERKHSARCSSDTIRCNRCERVQRRRASRPGAGVNRSRVWLWILLLVQLARLTIGALFEIVPQEAYYLFYARHPALSYFDHPGILAWALALPAMLRPPPPILVRLVPFVFAAVTLAGTFRLARRFVPEAAGKAVLLLATTGVFSILTVIALPDAPLVAAW